MSVHRIASRYAKSLIELSQEQNKLEQVKGDIDTFKKTLESRDFYLLLKSPVVPTPKKTSIMKAIFAGKLDELTMAWINILVSKGREPYLPEITKEFEEQYKKLKHITTVTVKTAKTLSADGLSAIKAALTSSKQTDDKVEIITKVDPDLIGGFVIEFGDRLYDASVKHKLELLKKEFVGNEYTSQILAR